jgi:hypothetical protein
VAAAGRLVGLAVVGNEADIVEAFVRHTLRFVDELVVVVHRPVDGTEEILRRLRSEGLPLALRSADHEGFRQAGETEPVARQLLASGAAAYVVLLDADEFLKAPDAGYLRRALPAIPAGKVGAWRWQGYVPLPEDDSAELNPIRRIRHRRAEEGIDCFKVVLTPEFAREEFFLLEGHHCVMQRNGGVPTPAPMVELKAVRLAHFPVRSREQLAAKVSLGEAAKRAAGMDDAALGSHWRSLAAAFSSGKAFGPEELARVAMRYPFPDDALLDVRRADLVEDPIAVEFALRYTAPPRRGPLP